MQCGTESWSIFLSEACIIYQNVLHENSWILCLCLHNWTERLDCLFPSNVWFNSAPVDESRAVSELQISVLAVCKIGRKRNDRLQAEKYDDTTISMHHSSFDGQQCLVP